MVSGYSPFERMNRLMSEMNEMMTQIGHETWGQGYSQPALIDNSAADTESANELAPWRSSESGLHTNVEATEEGYTVVADIPDIKTDELGLSFKEDDRLLRRRRSVRFRSLLGAPTYMH